jgi:hypothetical protein
MVTKAVALQGLPTQMDHEGREAHEGRYAERGDLRGLAANRQPSQAACRNRRGRARERDCPFPRALARVCGGSGARLGVQVAARRPAA